MTPSSSFQSATWHDPHFKEMRIELFTLCEGAVDQGGRLSLAGTYEVIQCPCFPTTVPKLTIAMRLRFWPGEAHHHSVRLCLVSPDGKWFGGAFEGTITLTPPDLERSSAHHFILDVLGVPFERAGEYAVDFYLDDHFESRIPLFVEAVG